MPTIRKIAKLVGPRLPLPERKITKPVSATITAKTINASVTKGALVGFAIRTAIDARQGKHLTRMQNAVFGFLERRKLTSKLLRRYQEMPEASRAALVKDYIAIKQTDLDTTLFNHFAEAAKNVDAGLEAARAAKTAYRMPTVIGEITVSQSSLAALLGKLVPTPRPDTYDFLLNYRGITTHKTSDRGGGGVEPYLVASFYRLPNDGSGLQPLREPFVIRQSPWGLHDMDDDRWMPSGGHQDSLGNPSNPREMFTGMFPPLGLDTLYFAIVKVMEEDGGQGEEIAKAMGDALLGVGGLLISTGNPAAVVVGIVLAVVGGVCELVSLMFASDDDPIGDLCMVFDATQICSGTFNERAERVISQDEDNDWTLYFGVSSAKR